MRIGRMKYTDIEAAAIAAAFVNAHSLLAAVHHAPFAAADAVDAMGVLGDANPLRHNKYAHPAAPPCRAATGAQTGHATAAQITKLNAIQALADVTAYGRLTVKGFQFNPATGTFNTTPEHINDGNTGTNGVANALNQYAEVLLPAPLHITQFRHFGNAALTGDGRWKIEYLDVAGAWQDWVENIVIRKTADWSGWDSSGGDVVAIAIRLVATTMDTLSSNIIEELEVKY